MTRIRSGGIKPCYQWNLDNTINSITGGLTGTHVRTSTATYIDPDDGLLKTASANIPRFESVGGHLALLTEPVGTNNAIYSRDLTNAAWVKTNCTGAKDQTGEDNGANSASSLLATAADATCFQTVTIAIADFNYAVSVKRITGTGNVFITDDGGANYTNITSLISAGSWYRKDITRNQANPVIGFKIATDTDKIAVDYTQLEGGKVATSRIETVASSVTRATESGYPRWTLPPSLFDNEGTAIIWARFGYASDVTGLVYSAVLSTRDSKASIIHNDTDSIDSADGTISAKAVLNSSANTWYKLIVKWGYEVSGVKKFRMGVDTGSGVSWGNEQSFDGAYTLGSYLRIGYDLFSRMHTRKLLLFRKALNDTMVNYWGGTP